MTTEIAPTRVRYIKLGRNGRWEAECREKGIIRFGFGSSTEERFPLCCAARWEELKKTFVEEGKDKGTATRFTNESKFFFEDDGSTLWVTFIGVELCWGFLTPDPPERHDDGDGVWRVVEGGWKSSDVRGEPLTKDKLAGSLTKLASYRGTSCRVDAAEYVINRINGKKL